MAWKKKDEEVGTQTLGIGDVKADHPPKPEEERESVGTAGEVEKTSATGSMKQTKGATGIDMGAGGTGTDIKP